MFSSKELLQLDTNKLFNVEEFVSNRSHIFGTAKTSGILSAKRAGGKLEKA